MLRANADASGHQIFAAEEDIILRELEITDLFLHNTGALPEPLAAGGARALAAATLQLTNVLAAGSPFRTLQILKRHPGLLRLTPRDIGARVLALKLLLPSCNVGDLLYQKPALLLMDDLCKQASGGQAPNAGSRSRPRGGRMGRDACGGLGRARQGVVALAARRRRESSLAPALP
ncbi:hypothetical protein MNEG_9251 [Monoraphidium neglectum]|uniref:Uncharacterized protein n=1 Tax=Monoraphidium neglectum TaxID=145388 RepID=A0A0D2MD71_9CHLO|nr:hypothetical protein MNEG_9251 [Monoraphidium neglectum]KIY98711.1 hypothetical protein MNEG_9251 [Monoraphidium neglectum]|eukprot:XP_013897731.1 hypothetical protein MNEG_9251 [Monoraphidium neglectum]